jgi:ADP-ribosylglycohydrolase
MNPPTHSLLGTALGDSLGLPSEGMSRGRIARRWPHPLKQRLVLGRGMLSDDTEHSIFVAHSLLQCGGDADRFQRVLAAKLRWWFAGLPAGIGLATAKAIIKLWLGFPPGRNGVFSAGNGPVMRAPIIGVFFADDPAQRSRFVTASTRLTHTDPRALEAAEMAATAAAFAAKGEANERLILDHLTQLGHAPEWAPALARLAPALEAKVSVADFAESCGWRDRVSGYAPHTTLMALFIWLRHRGDFKESIAQAVACGGDTDTLAAIVGGIAGAETSTFPAAWLTQLRDCPWTVAYLRRLGDSLTSTRSPNLVSPPPLAWWWLPLRNLLFLVVVLAHGFRRLLPPY